MSEEVIGKDTAGYREIAPEAKAAVKEALMGPGMRRLTQQRQSAYLDLKNSGRLRPATVVNFNPVSLKVDDGHVPWRIPAATDASAKRIEMQHGGKTYIASYFTVREPSFVPWIRDVRPPSDEGENPSSEFDAKFILPIEMMDQYRISYNDPAGQTLMGGVLVFEGDINAFTKGKTIRVPKFSTLPDRTRSYFTVETDTLKATAATLEMQKEFCERNLQRGDEYKQDEQQAKNITTPMRMWAQFALDMGWKQTAPEWMNSKLESEVTCRACGKGRKRTDAHFCDCGRPYDPLAAFLDGENVPESYLFALKGKDLELAIEETSRREAVKAKFYPKAK